MGKSFYNTLNINQSNLKYYITDYKSFGKQMDYLLAGYAIPYKEVTSISLEAYNIPPKIYNNFNKFLYFKIDHSDDYRNTLQYLVFSFYLVLDKKNLDKFLKAHKITFNYYLNHIYTITSKKVIHSKIKKSVHKQKKVVKKIVKKKPKKPPYALKLKFFFYMKEYGFIPQKKEYKLETNINNDILIDIYSKLNGLTYELKNSFDKTFMLNPKEKIELFVQKIDNIASKLYNLNFYANIKKPECLNYSYSLKCFKDPIYFHNFLHLQLNKNKPLNIDTLLKYGDYKSFNDAAKYYFEIGEYKKAEILLQKAYALKKDPIVIHNLAVLYMSKTPLLNMKKGIEYLKNSSLPIDYYNMGVLYYIGKDVKENNKRAREYFLKAKGIPYADENIKIMNKYKIGFK